MSRVMFINIATYSISISSTFKIFIADDFVLLNGKSTSLESVVKSLSKMIQGVSY